jgi:hypothetical protein
MSAPPVSRNGSQTPNGHNSRAGTPVQSASPSATGSSRKGAVAQLGLGPKPQLDEQRIGELLALKPGMYLFRAIFTYINAGRVIDQLSLLPLASLEAYLSELRMETQNTSALLTYVLQTKDALQQDSETYNKLIGELVGEAQKMKTVGGKSLSRRGSGKA